VAQELLAAGSYQAPLLPNFAEARVTVFTNTTNNVAEGRVVPSGPRLHTLWGELAWQLGGAAAYERVRTSDEERISPGGTFQRVLELVGEQHGPALLLLDELADYCVHACRPPAKW
jgi:predicted AAA+ superfamily ATPase